MKMDRHQNGTNIVIIMAAFNGEKYIEEQIQSIREQSYTNWVLYIFDDCSDDKTSEILERMSKNDSRIKVFHSEKNLGATQNFLSALEFAYKERKFDYYMFCDQDDIWNTDKIEISIKRIQEEEKLSRAVVVHTDLTVVDSSGTKVIAESLRKFAHLKKIKTNVFQRILTQPYAFGCTMMLNDEAVMKLLPASDDAYSHDSWAAAITAAHGKVSYIEQPTIKYRQHESNVSGSGLANSAKSRFIRITLGFSEQVQITARRIMQCRAVLEHIDSDSREYKILSEYYNACKKNGFCAVYMSLKYRFLRQGFFANVWYFITLFFIDRKVL